jgi:hypothetical protein
VSFAVEADDQAQADHYWAALTGLGGEPVQCGWLKDRYGVSWQVYPVELGALLNDPDPERANRATVAMLQQGRIDLAEIRAAMAAAIDRGAGAPAACRPSRQRCVWRQASSER